MRKRVGRLSIFTDRFVRFVVRRFGLLCLVVRISVPITSLLIFTLMLEDTIDGISIIASIARDRFTISGVTLLVATSSCLGLLITFGALRIGAGLLRVLLTLITSTLSSITFRRFAQLRITGRVFAVLRIAVLGIARWFTVLLTRILGGLIARPIIAGLAGGSFFGRIRFRLSLAGTCLVAACATAPLFTLFTLLITAVTILLRRIFCSVLIRFLLLSNLGVGHPDAIISATSHVGTRLLTRNATIVFGFSPVDQRIPRGQANFIGAELVDKNALPFMGLCQKRVLQ